MPLTVARLEQPNSGNQDATMGNVLRFSSRANCARLQFEALGMNRPLSSPAGWSHQQTGCGCEQPTGQAVQVYVCILYLGYEVLG